MKRTTVVLPNDLAALLDWERRRRGVSAASIVREDLDAYLIERRKPLSIIGLGRSGYQNTAEDVEEILAREWTYDHIMGHADATPSDEQQRDGSPSTGAATAEHDGSKADGERGDGDSPVERNGEWAANVRAAHDANVRGRNRP